MKYKVLLVTILFLSSLFVSPASATEGLLIDSYPETNQDAETNMQSVHPAIAGTSSVGQTFNATGDYYISSVKFYIRKSGAPTGTDAVAVLYNHSGAFGAGVPNGIALATSMDYNVADLGGALALVEFTFQHPYLVTAGTPYCIAYQNPSAGIDAGNYVIIGRDSSAPTHNGNMFWYNAGAWGVVAGNDVIFYLYGAPSTWSGYNFTDTYYENGTLYRPSILVTATGSGFIDMFNTSGGSTQYFPSDPELFYWEISYGGTTTSRRIYSIGPENITITEPELDFDTFVFTVRDFTGKLSLGDGYLEAYRIINSTNTLIERQKIDVHNEVPLNLVIGATYTIRVRFYDGSYYDWGTFVPGDSTTFTIVLRGVEFSDQAYQASNFIFIEVTRPTGTTFTVDYLATKNQTVWSNVTIQIRGGAIVATVSRTNNSYVYNYAGALANTSYVVIVEGQHTLLNAWGYTKIFDASETFPDVPDMEDIFPMGDLDAGNLIGWVLTIISGLTFSVVYKRAALIAIAAMGSFVTVFGFTDWSYYLLAFVWFFGIIVYIGSSDRT